MRASLLSFAVLLTACGGGGSRVDDDAGMPEPTVCPGTRGFELGTDIEADLSAISATRAVAGRIRAADLPTPPHGRVAWEDGDFVIANDRVAMVIEQVDDSDRYDPWGGRPVGTALVRDGALVEPSDFGEIFILVSRFTPVTECVTVINDGSDGEAVVVRAAGMLRPLPFLNKLTRAVFNVPLENTAGAIEYRLEPGATHVDIDLLLRSEFDGPIDGGLVLRGFMYTERMIPWLNGGPGFAGNPEATDFIAFVDEVGASYTYSLPDGGAMNGFLAQSGFYGMSTLGLDIPGEPDDPRVPYARIAIGGPGLNGALEAHAEMEGNTLRVVTGRVVEPGTSTPRGGVMVNAVDSEGAHLGRATADEDGTFRLVLAEGVDALVHVVDGVLPSAGPYVAGLGNDALGDVDAPARGFVVVEPTTEDGGDDDGRELPARIQVWPADGDPAPSRPPGNWAPERAPSGRAAVAYALPGERTVIAVPPGDYQVMVSHGFEYEIDVEDVTVAGGCDPALAGGAGGACPVVTSALERSVDTADHMCGDFHIHAIGSNDSGDPLEMKLRAAGADAVELAVRTEHELVEDWDELVLSLGLGEHIIGPTGIEMTTFLDYGHFTVMPLDPDSTRINGGAPLWQRWPTPGDLDQPLETLDPPELFEQVLARDEAPTLMINHPRGSGNYFDDVGLDRVDGMIMDEDRWAPIFHGFEVFNSSTWQRERDGLVQDWFRLMDDGLQMTAVGSSDSHGIVGSPVGSPRTCLDVGRDTPPDTDRRGFANTIRDSIIDGTGWVSGGIAVQASVDGQGPSKSSMASSVACGDGNGQCVMLDLRIQAPSWVDVDELVVIVDGSVFHTLRADGGADGPFVAGDAPAEVHEGSIEVPVASGSYIVVAAYGGTPLATLPREEPFGVSQAIYVE